MVPRWGAHHPHSDQASYQAFAQDNVSEIDERFAFRRLESRIIMQFAETPFAFFDPSLNPA